MKYKSIYDFTEGIIILQTRAKERPKSALASNDSSPRPVFDRISAINSKILCKLCLPCPKIFAEKLSCKGRDLLKAYEKSLSEPHIKFSLDSKFTLDDYQFQKPDGSSFQTRVELVLSLFQYGFHKDQDDKKPPQLEDIVVIIQMTSTHPLSTTYETKPDPSGVYRDRLGYRTSLPHFLNLLKSSIFLEALKCAKKMADPNHPGGSSVQPGFKKQAKSGGKRSSSVPDTPTKKKKKPSSDSSGNLMNELVNGQDFDDDPIGGGGSDEDGDFPESQALPE